MVTLNLGWGLVSQRFSDFLLYPQLWVFSLCCASERLSFHDLAAIPGVLHCDWYLKVVNLMVGGKAGLLRCDN